MVLLCFYTECVYVRWRLGVSSTVITVKFACAESTCGQRGRVALHGWRCWTASVMHQLCVQWLLESFLANSTSPQSNLRRARRSSADKTITRIASYWDHTALACCCHSKRVEPSRKIRLDLALHMHHMRLYGVPLQKWLPATTAQSSCCICFVTFLNFSSTSTSMLNLTIS